MAASDIDDLLGMPSIAMTPHEGKETRQLALDLSFIPVVPPLRTRIEPWEYDREMYKRRATRSSDCSGASRASAASSRASRSSM